MYRISKSIGLGFEGTENETFYLVYRDGVIYAHKYGDEPWIVEKHDDNIMCLTRSKAWHIADKLFTDELPEWVDKGCSITLEEECRGICYLLDMSTRTIIGKGRV